MRTVRRGRRSVSNTLVVCLCSLACLLSVSVGPGTAAAAPGEIRDWNAWYGRAYAIQVWEGGGAYAFGRTSGIYPVGLERQYIGGRAGLPNTGWFRSPGVSTGAIYADQWAFLVGYNGIQFRLCRYGIPGVGTECATNRRAFWRSGTPPRGGGGGTTNNY